MYAYFPFVPVVLQLCVDRGGQYNGVSHNVAPHGDGLYQSTRSDATGSASILCKLHFLKWKRLDFSITVTS